MGFRWDASYELVKEGVVSDERIPPLIFHTLIENGLTHSYKPKENGTFHFTRMEKNGTVQYCMQNDGSLLKRFEENSTEEIDEGMGFKYVKARLEESYPGNWSISYGMRDHQWEVTIEIRNQVPYANRDPRR
jgi:LytS/YehU family sensor histidine kinase